MIDIAHPDFDPLQKKTEFKEWMLDEENNQAIRDVCFDHMNERDLQFHFIQTWVFHCASSIGAGWEHEEDDQRAADKVNAMTKLSRDLLTLWYPDLMDIDD